MLKQQPYKVGHVRFDTNNNQHSDQPPTANGRRGPPMKKRPKRFGPLAAECYTQSPSCNPKRNWSIHEFREHLKTNFPAPEQPSDVRTESADSALPSSPDVTTESSQLSSAQDSSPEVMSRPKPTVLREFQGRSSEKQPKGRPNKPVDFRDSLWQFCKDGKYANVALIVDGYKYHVDKLVVAVGSKYFEQMFANDSQSAEFEVSGIKKEVMEAVLEFLYRGHLDNYAKWGSELADAAEKLGVDSLKERCPKSVTHQPAVTPQRASPRTNNRKNKPRPSPWNINKENLITSIIQSMSPEDIPHQNAILTFMRANGAQIEEVRQSDEFNQLRQTDLSAFNKVQWVLSRK